MSFGPHRTNAPRWIKSIVDQSRKDLENEKLNWYLSQQSPTDDKSVNMIDVISEVEKIVMGDEHLFQIKTHNIIPQTKKLVISTEGIIQLGNILCKFYLDKTN